jgi:hypothetical protein
MGVDERWNSIRTDSGWHATFSMGVAAATDSGAADPESSCGVVKRDERRTGWGGYVHGHTIGDVRRYTPITVTTPIDRAALDQLREQGRKLEFVSERIPVTLTPAIDPGIEALGFPKPSAEAMTLSYALARGALPTLAAEIDRYGTTVRFASGDEPMLAPSEVPRRYAHVGLPLYGATSPPHRAENVLRQIAARSTSKGFVTRRDWLAKELNKLMASEHALWVLAREPRIPYGFAFLALVWLGRGVYERGTQERVLPCLQCGALIRPQRTTKRLPRCASCETKAARTAAWPDHAVMPAHRGDWWLKCLHPGCTKVFAGRRQALFCPPQPPAWPGHRSAKITPLERRSAGR